MLFKKHTDENRLDLFAFSHLNILPCYSLPCPAMYTYH